MPSTSFQHHGFVVEIRDKQGHEWIWMTLHTRKENALREGFMGWPQWIREVSGYDTPEKAWDDLAMRAKILQRFRRGRGPCDYLIRAVRARLVKIQ